jgi:hypothetical protein
MTGRFICGRLSLAPLDPAADVMGGLQARLLYKDLVGDVAPAKQ